MSCAPCKASSADCTSFSILINSTAFLAGSSFLYNNNHSANGSNPLSLAIVAFVLLFSLYGRYRSSTSCNFVALTICCRSSSVSFPFSSIRRRTSSFLSSSCIIYCHLSKIVRICTSSKEPVHSFR
ncbi:Uncharacterised protein [Streptococcus pneumoniae]|nr:Uncharacterised protein [Streptococcus pneumoniae]COF72850.1 Uncharacterised protein [Streptococcus pneumoniae]COQ05583.1 Uncharacterised protein [Streptococcus pneumoniae]